MTQDTAVPSPVNQFMAAMRRAAQRQEDEYTTLARVLGQTVADLDADWTAPDPREDEEEA